MRRLVLSLAFLCPSLALAHPLDDLEPGHWMVVSNNTIADVDPCPAQDCSYSAVEGISGVIDDWNGGALASGHGELGGLVVWGGGHNGYFGSEVYVFDIAMQTWVRASEPYDNGAESVAPDCNAQGVYPDGSACPAHTYDRVDYHPGTNRFVIMSGTPDPVCGGCDDNVVHLFDLDDGAWSLGAAIPDPQPVTGAMSAYDGTRDVFWFLGTYGVPPLRRYDPVADEWTLHGAVAQPLEIDGAAVHDPVHDALLHHDPLGSQALYAFDLADPDAAAFELTVEGDLEILGQAKIGFEWDPVQERVVAWDDGSDVYVIAAPEGDWKAGTWTVTRFAAAETNDVVPQRGINGTYSRFRYVPSVNAFVVVSSVDGPVWGYKASADPGTGPNGEDTGSSGGADDSATSAGDDAADESGSATTGATGAGGETPGGEASDDEASVGTEGGTTPADADGSGGCGCSSGSSPDPAGLLGIALLGLRRRRLALVLTAAACTSDGEPAGDGTDDGTAGSSATVSSTDPSPSTTVGEATSSDPTVDDGSTDDEDSGSSTDDTGVPTGGCFGPGEVPGSVAPHGFAMPMLADERATYERWGLTWAPEAEPNVPAEPSFAVMDPDIHGDTEADDLWTYVMMHARTGEPGYLDRSTAWRRYFVEDYASCVGGEYASFCYDRDAFGADHLWGWGLLAWHETMADAEALAAAEQIGGVVEDLWAPDSPFGCLPSGGCVYYGLRQIGRHLLLVGRLAELTGDARWIDLRDRMIDTLLAAEEWDAERGMWFQGDFGTDDALGPGAWAAGARVQSPFMIGVIGEAIDHAYRTTGREELRERMIAMADYVDQHGLDPTYDYTGSMFGIVNGQTWHNYGATEPVEFWDPVYTTSLVNVLVRGWRYTCDPHYYERARHFFERGNRGIYGEPTATAVPDGQIHHFVDTVFDTSSGSFYLGYNKGELQYTYLLFDPDAP